MIRVVALSAILVNQLVAGELPDQMTAWQRSTGRVMLATRRCRSADAISTTEFVKAPLRCNSIMLAGHSTLHAADCTWWLTQTPPAPAADALQVPASLGF